MSKARLRMTVVTPTLNQARFIAATLRSVLDQNLGPRLQYIIRDACSTDGTEAIVREFEPAFVRQGVEWRYVRERDTGQSDAINRGWREATGDILGYLNSDDMYRPGALATVLDFFEQQPNFQWAYGGWRLVGESGEAYSTTQPKKFCRRALLNYCNIGQPAVFFRRTLLAETGDLNPLLHLAMDYDLWLRMSARGPAGIIPTVLADLRYYPNAKSAFRTREQVLEIYRVGRQYSRPWSWRRCAQTFYCLRGLVVVALGWDVARRIERWERRGPP